MKMYARFLIFTVLAFGATLYALDDSLSLEQWKKTLSENDEYLHALQTLDRNVMENAKVLIHNLRTKTTTNYAMVKYHSDEIGRSLAVSEDYLTRLTKATDFAIDRIYLAYLADLHQYYRRAIATHRQLQEELVNALPARTVLIMKAMVIYSEMEKAGREKLDLDLKMEIQEPGFPGIVR